MAAGLPARLAGLVAALAPRAGPQLTQDPLGLLFERHGRRPRRRSTSRRRRDVGDRARRRPAGLARLARGSSWPGPCSSSPCRRSRSCAWATAPAWCARRIPRSCRRRPTRRRLAAGRSPYTPPLDTTPPGREAVSSSFRLDPPAAITPDRPLAAARPVRARRGVARRGLARPADRRPAGASRVLGLVVARELGRTAACRSAPSRCSRRRSPSARRSDRRSPLALLALVARVALPCAGAGACQRGCWPASPPPAITARCSPRSCSCGAAVRGAARRPACGPPRRRLLAALAGYALVVVPVLLLDASAFLERLRQGVVPAPASASSTCSPIEARRDRPSPSGSPRSDRCWPWRLTRAPAAASRRRRRPWRRSPASSAIVAGAGRARPRSSRCRSLLASARRASGRGLDRSGCVGLRLVPEAGFEPARISPHAPQTCVSANSTTPARRANHEPPILCGRTVAVNARALHARGVPV